MLFVFVYNHEQHDQFTTRNQSANDNIPVKLWPSRFSRRAQFSAATGDGERISRARTFHL
jgi:hypothetical protein